MNHPNRTAALFKQARQLCAQFGQWGQDALTDVLGAQALVESLQRHAGAYRERYYPPLRTLQMFVQQVLDGDGACLDAVSMSTAGDGFLAAFEQIG